MCETALRPGVQIAVLAATIVACACGSARAESGRAVAGRGDDAGGPPVGATRRTAQATAAPPTVPDAAGAVGAGGMWSRLLGGVSDCPEPRAVWTELGALLPVDRVEEELRPLVEASPRGAPPPVQIVDLGPRYRVIAAGRVREYRDEARDCKERARVAAIFVGLALDPVNLSRGEGPPAVTPAATPAPVTVNIRENVGPSSSFDIGPAIDVGLASSGAAADARHVGGAARLVLGRGPLALVVGAFLATPATSEVDGVRLRRARLPIDLGARFRARGLAAEPHVELGVSVAVVSAQGMNLATTDGRKALEAGVYAAVGVRLFARARIAPFLLLRGEWVPEPVILQALPRGIVGHTPRLWIGATMGASFGF